MIPARQSTTRTLIIGPVLDADGAAVTDSVVGDFKISKNGAAPAALNGSATLTHRHTGFYSLALTTSDLDTVGTAQITTDDTVNTCPMATFLVIEEAIYDAIWAASANAFTGAAGSTTLTALASGSITAAVIATGAIDADAIADNAIDAGAIASDAITAAKIATGAISAAKFAASAIDAAALATDAVQEIRNSITGGAYALSTDANGMVRIVDGTGAGELSTTSGFLDWSAAWDAEVQSEVNDGLVAFFTSAAALVDLVWEEDLTDHSGTVGSVAEALAAAGSAGDPWATALPGAYGAGTAGRLIGRSLPDIVAGGSGGLLISGSNAGTTTLGALTVTGATTLTGALTATNASNNLTLGTFEVEGTLFTNWFPSNFSNLIVALDGLVASNLFEINNVAVSTTTAQLGVNVVNAGGTAWGSGAITAASVATGAIDADALATDGIEEIRNAITGGAYALSTDANGRIRIVDGTAAGEINTNAGAIALVDLVTDITTKTGYRLSATGVDDVWDEDATGHQTQGTFGQAIGDPVADSDSIWALVNTNLNATVSSRASQTSVDDLPTNAELATALGTADDAVLAAIAALNNLSSAQAQTAAAAALTAYDPPTNAEMEARTLVAANYFDPAVDQVIVNDFTPTALTEIRTYLHGGDFAGQLDASGYYKISDGTGTGQIDLTSGGVLVSALSTQAKADVNGELVDVLAVDTYGEPAQGTPPATTTLAVKINYLAMQQRNKKTQTTTQFSVYADDGTTLAYKAACSEVAGLVTFGELITGA